MCTQAIDPGASRSALTSEDTSRTSRSPANFFNFPFTGSAWLAHGSPLHGDQFPNLMALFFGVRFCSRYRAFLSDSFDALLPSATPWMLPSPLSRVSYSLCLFTPHWAASNALRRNRRIAFCLLHWLPLPQHLCLSAPTWSACPGLLRVYTPPHRWKPFGAGQKDCFVRKQLLLPPRQRVAWRASPSFGVLRVRRPPPPSGYLCLCSPSLTPLCLSGPLFSQCALRLPLFCLSPSPNAPSACLFPLGLFFLVLHLPPVLLSCRLPLRGSLPQFFLFRVSFPFLYPPPCMNAEHNNSTVSAAHLLSLFLWPPRPRRAFPAPIRPHRGGRHFTVLLPLNSPRPAPVCHRAPHTRTAPYGSSPVPCALCCSSLCHVCMLLTHTRRSATTRSSFP